MSKQMKKCVVDGTEFEAKRADAKYCSPKCRMEASRKADAKKSKSEKTVGKDAYWGDEPVESDKDKPYDREKHLKAFQRMGLQRVDWITTGIPEFDKLTKIPRGRITQIQGPYAVGKTTLCLNMIQGLKDKKIFYIDSEATLNPDFLADLELNSQNFHLYNESAFIEDIYEQIIAAVDSEQYDMIVFDSLAACTFRTEAEGMSTDANIGQKAKIVNKLMRIVPSKLRDTNTALVIINQEREVIGSYAPIKYTPGGMGVVYAASLMIQLRTNKSARFPKSGPPYKGQTITAEIIKSKVNEPWRKAEFKLYYKQADRQ